MKYYWVDADGYDTQIYTNESEDKPITGEYKKLSEAKKEAIDYMRSIIRLYRLQIKYIQKSKAKDVKEKEWY